VWQGVGGGGKQGGGDEGSERDSGVEVDRGSRELARGVAEDDGWRPPDGVT